MYTNFLILSAGFIDWRQTKHRKSIIYLLRLPVEQVYGSQRASEDIRGHQRAGMGLK
jgi:hypothetical protein